MTKILLVEDNEFNRIMLSRRLELKQYEIICATDGLEAVDMTKANGSKPASERWFNSDQRDKSK